MKAWFFRKIWLPLYGRWALQYVRRARRFDYAGLRVQVPVGVFHPGLYFSTTEMINYLKTISLDGKNVLDLGSGSGMLGLFAANMGAQVTAVDISPLAVAATGENARRNNLKMEAFESDLFEQIAPVLIFDYILVNPPYFAAAPRNMADRAFFAGAQLEYFEAFFAGVTAHLAPNGIILMILGSGCDFDKISTLATRTGFIITPVVEKSKWSRSILIWQLERNL